MLEGDGKLTRLLSPVVIEQKTKSRHCQQPAASSQGAGTSTWRGLLAGGGSRMGRKDASATKLPVDQYRKQIGKQDYKKTKSVLKATRLKAEAKKNSSVFRDGFLVLVAIAFFVVCVYAFFYLNLSNEINMDMD
ncbi:triple QxxK/R motif-containing protein isoform X1 [Nerophis lumbriciformis]|uniref:triple QxxK/R motif-containing protein isoform X1 n=2 Tax=Nerophis lumbriciformis TaxID=546530 RepID=UPI002AE0A6CA|nr:triple QxxK/R motif-containing protein-like isoform X1 [Nerophis lumbriciformis]